MKFALLLMTLVVGQAFGNTVGLSTHPFSMKKNALSAGIDNYFSNGEGTGFSARYLRRINQSLNVDAGFGFTDGDRSSRFFAGADYEIIPDYGRQPRVSIKGLLENTDFDGDTVNSIGFAPTISKGFSFWGEEGYPFLSLPYRIHLNDDTGEYETAIGLTLGMTGNLPIDDFRNLIGNIEATIDIDNNYSALVLGIGYAL